MKSDSLQKATISIAGKEFPLKLDKKEMKKLSSIEQEINKKINHYQSQFANMSLKDSIIMVLISYAFELKNASSESNPELLEQTLSQLEGILSSE